MEMRDFVFHFTDILFSEMAKEATLIENWENTTFDQRYVLFADAFVNMKNSCSVPGCTDRDIFDRLRNSRKGIIDSYNKSMRQNFIGQFERNGLKATIFDQALPSDILKEDEINSKSLELFRQFEEKTFTEKTEGRS